MTRDTDLSLPHRSSENVTLMEIGQAPYLYAFVSISALSFRLYCNDPKVLDRQAFASIADADQTVPLGKKLIMVSADP